MSRLLFSILTICTLMVLSLGSATARAEEAPVFVRLVTQQGEMLGVFYPELAPNHVASFIHLSRTGFYNGTKFHRIVPGFVIQGGDPLSKDMDPRNDGSGGPRMSDVLSEDEARLVDEVNAMLDAKGYLGIDGEASLKAEFSRTAKHKRGALSMARGRPVDSAGSQFFVCVEDTPQLDGQYTLFGFVFMGMEVADQIVNAEKGKGAGPDAPKKPVAIINSEIIEGVDGLRADEKTAWEALASEHKNVK